VFKTYKPFKSFKTSDRTALKVHKFNRASLGAGVIAGDKNWS
jgi:hypothetical protein